MINQFILDDSGNPVPCPDISLWGKWMNEIDNRVVAKDEHGDSKVSTVFLGIDHNFRDDGPPVLWETMVFGGRLDGEQERYTDHRSALRGHVDMVVRVIQAEKP